MRWKSQLAYSTVPSPPSVTTKSNVCGLVLHISSSQYFSRWNTSQLASSLTSPEATKSRLTSSSSPATSNRLFPFNCWST